VLKDVYPDISEFENLSKNIQVEIKISLPYPTMGNIVYNREIAIELDHKIRINVFFDGKKIPNIVEF